MARKPSLSNPQATQVLQKARAHLAFSSIVPAVVRATAMVRKDKSDEENKCPVRRGGLQDF